VAWDDLIILDHDPGKVGCLSLCVSILKFGIDWLFLKPCAIPTILYVE
jgi:hypothetical protein